ncbi:Dynamin-related protein 4C [Spatholobus suberectus]|nr:Dynamin-related protein 4C [Spatholobus suberectus]
MDIAHACDSAGGFYEYPDDKHMHCTARLVDMLDQCSNDLHKGPKVDAAGENFLMEEIKVLEDAKWIGLPNFMPGASFLNLLQNKVKVLSSMPIEFTDKVWAYLEEVVAAVLMRHSEHYHQLQTCTRRAGQSLIAKMKENSMKYVMEYVEMEKLTDYTCNPEYMCEYNKLMANQDIFLNTSKKYVLGCIHSSKLRSATTIVAATIFNLVNKDLGDETVKDTMSPYGGGIERLLEETPSVAEKRDKLNRRIKVLKESKEVVANIMDKISSYGD